MLDATLRVTTDDGVTFALTVANGGDDPVEVTFRDAGKADFAVYDGDEELWRWSEEKAFAQMIQTGHFDPGEEATFEAEWPAPRDGEFTAEAELRVRESDIVARTQFSV